MGRIDLVEIRRRQAAREKQKRREVFVRTRLKNWRWYVWLPVGIPFGLFVILFSYSVEGLNAVSRFFSNLENRFDRSIRPYTGLVLKWLNAPYEKKKPNTVTDDEEEDDE